MLPAQAMSLTMASWLTLKRSGSRRNHVTFFVRAQEDVFGVEKIHVRGGRAATGEPGSARPKHARIARRSALETAVVDDVGIHELQRGETRHALLFPPRSVGSPASSSQ